MQMGANVAAAKLNSWLMESPHTADTEESHSRVGDSSIHEWAHVPAAVQLQTQQLNALLDSPVLKNGPSIYFQNLVLRIDVRLTGSSGFTNHNALPPVTSFCLSTSLLRVLPGLVWIYTPSLAHPSILQIWNLSVYLLPMHSTEDQFHDDRSYCFLTWFSWRVNSGSWKDGTGYA